MPATLSTGDALLAAVLAFPDEDTPRLVYADWLDEHSCPERAEFIRVQIAAAGPWTPEVGWRHDNRADKVRKKAAKRGESWANNSPREGVKYTFRRGFVERVECSLAAWVGVCVVCNGTGRTGGPVSDDCLGCTGRSDYIRTPGIGPAVVKAHPVREVRLFPLKPALWRDSAFLPSSHEHRGKLFWYANGGVEIPDPANTGIRHWLPHKFNAVAHQMPWGERWRDAYFFATEETAVRWLSDLAILWAKSAPASA